MATYFFHLNECGAVMRDDEGVELPDSEAARAYAIIAAREIMAAEMMQGRLCMSCSIMIDDRAGRVLDLPFFLAVTEYHI